MSRRSFVRTIVTLLSAIPFVNIKPDLHGEDPFWDVPTDRWWGKLVQRMGKLGYFKGKGVNITEGTAAGKTNFGPLDKLTRAEAAVLIVRALRGSDFEPPLDTLSVYSDHWGSSWLHYAYSHDLMHSGGAFVHPETFGPDAPALRSDVAVIMALLLEA